ncbi:MAG: tetratricopeptide repeat protein [Desulfobacterium sp.]|nr:tetratricopeptide repeat protein [Desulfobacteraceae bacterium]MBA3037162.1 tetratricopeptide repeat protein [Desulfobacterium sp.]MBU4036963.1 tetratricopeptide repeat protein [Pseudomonadota bacterium]
MNLFKDAVVVLLAFVVTGCASAINTTNAEHHATSANEAGKAGDWTTARKQWAQALVNAQLAGASAQQLAVINYEYGRALGVQCFWDEAENYLLKAYELDFKTSGPEFMSLTELSRLKYDQKQYDKAVGYYKIAIQAMEKAGAPEKAPSGFADILDEYASALQNEGKVTESTVFRSKADELRRLNPGGHSITDRTPYGTQCTSEKP